MAATTATCQALWLNRLISEMRGQEPTKFKLLIDNKSAIALAKNPVHHDRNKHIDVKYHFIRECIDEGLVEVNHVWTNYQLADVLTKAVGRVRFVEMRQKLGVREIGDKP